MWKRLTMRLGVQVALLLSTGSMALPAMAVDEPAFTLIGKSGRIEVREYAAYLVAETRVKADFAEAGNLAFRPLFNYISGNNRRQEKIEMTAPVSQSAERASGEKIDMNAPVSQTPVSEDTGHYVIALAMPGRYTRETIPLPEDERVSIREIPSRKMAVLSYSGAWSAARYGEHEKVLSDEITKAGWRARGMVEFARYDPPFMPWFLRRNEVMVEVEPRDVARN
jgi:hypothetical protein